jgi:pyruvate formate lyase activating enzyme
VQRFSVHDGPGIRTTVFFKGCPLRCRWCQNPESLRPHPEIAFFADRCRSSFECLPSCPTLALTRTPERLARDRCDLCGKCLSACAYGALQPVGREYAAAELADQIARDAPFFRTSGGGATLSGGEPTLQLPFARALAELLQQKGISVGLQTCGAFAWDGFAPLLPLLDFVYFDLKHSDPDEHRRWTGSDNAAIRENARKLAASGVSVTFRMPVVPGANDGDENLAATARFLTEIGSPRLHLLAYHSMGLAKLVRVGSPLPPLEIPTNTEASARRLQHAATRLEAHGIEVTS